MPRKIVIINELTDAAAITARSYCSMCGAGIGSGVEVYSEDHSPLDVARSLAVYFDEDRTACSVLLVYVDKPLSTVSEVAKKLSLSPACICAARKRAAEKFPSLAGVLGRNTPRARGQQKRFSSKAL